MSAHKCRQFPALCNPDARKTRQLQEAQSLLQMNAMRTKRIAAAVTLILCFNVIAFSQSLPMPGWTPPASRTGTGPFAPKPLPIHNIFKGDADRWLAEAIEKLEGQIADPLRDKLIEDYVSMVGENVAKYSVAPTKKYQFIVTYDPTADAMTPGGGRIYISLGMLELIENEDELAGILAHEIGHDAFHHAARTVTRQMFWLTGTKTIRSAQDAEDALAKLNEKITFRVGLGERLLGFARFDELEADRAAFYNVYKAGYNPHALATSLKRLQRQKDQSDEDEKKLKLFLLLFGSHPPTGQRTSALTWESNFVKMPAENSFHVSAAFEAMKQRVKEITKED